MIMDFIAICKRNNVAFDYFSRLLRSLNLATSVGIGLYEALRKTHAGQCI